jgi:hypothetical protein
MMAHDTGPNPPDALAPETVEAVRLALEGYSRSPTKEPATDVRRALHQLAREARQKDVSPEQLLVVLKGIWYALPEVRIAGGASEQVHVLQRVVTMCIQEYFAD